MNTDTNAAQPDQNPEAQSPPTPLPAHTALGTPCSPAWDAAHIARVDAAESQRGKRICGARTRAGNLCLFPPNHDNGRCKYHGGFNLTGAQPGNRNAIVHGLYSRAIQICGPQCPMWKSCPCASPDVEALPPTERPHCPYETTAFNTALTDLRTQAATTELREPMSEHEACELAMNRVMLLRAAAALAVQPMVEIHAAQEPENAPAQNTEAGETSPASPPQPRDTRPRPSAYLQAWLRVSSEHRRYVHLYRRRAVRPPADAVIFEQERRALHDTSTLPEDLAQLDTHETPRRRRAQELLADAEEAARHRNFDRAAEHFHRAARLSPELEGAAYDPQSPWYLRKYAEAFPRPHRSAG